MCDKKYGLEIYVRERDKMNTGMKKKNQIISITV